MKYKVLICLLCFLPFMVKASDKSNKNILLINSYNLGYSWTDDQMQGYRSVFDTCTNVELFIHFMDSRRYRHGDHANTFFDFLEDRYQDIPIDAIIVNDNDALDMMLERRANTIFDSIPISCTGISNVNDYDIETEDLYMVEEVLGILPNIQSINHVFKHRKTIYFLIDVSTSGKIYKALIEDYTRLFPALSFIVVDSLTEDNYTNVAQRFIKNSVVYYLGISQGKDGELIQGNKIISDLAANFDLPIYSSFINVIPGILGGEHNSGVFHGEASAKQVLNLLKGERPKERLVKQHLEFVYNYPVMQKFGVKIKDLPPGTGVINRPVSIYQKYKFWIIGNGILLLLLFFIIVLMIRNALMQKKYQQSIILARDNAMQSDRLKSAFLANVSHEFRTPLNAIVGFSDLLKIENENEDLDKYICFVNENADLLTQLINDVLDLSLIDANQVRYQKEDVNLDSMFESIYAQGAKLLIDNNKLQINLVLGNHDNADNVIFYTDEKRFRQLLLNLLQNAIKFTHQGYIEFGFDIVSAEFIKSHFENDDKLNNSKDYVYVYVNDSGIGIPENMVELVFDRFTRVDNKEVQNISGTGLGLSICKSIIENLGGRIEVNSEVNVGSQFHFYLPIDDVDN